MARSDDSSPTNATEFSVSELSRALKRTVEEAYGYVRVRGEISGLVRPRSGHVYWALKDADSLIDAVMWRGNANKLTFNPEDGLEVVCTGKLTTYGARSKYQIVVDRMEPAGAGALMALLEERKKKLAAEGLFAETRKKALPWLPMRIGVVTSPTGAVIRDILHRLADRFPRPVLLWPVKVQGQGAAEEIAHAIQGFNTMPADQRPDLLIIARGGGSLEDLWAFNEEIVVRAAAASAIPLISAVGHETDTTLIDYASDKRAPTPTAAAEIAVPVRADLQAGVLDLEQRLLRAQARAVQDRRGALQSAARGLPRITDLLGPLQQRHDATEARLGRALATGLAAKKAGFDTVAARLSPVRLVDRLGHQSERLEGRARQLDRAGGLAMADRARRLGEIEKLLNAYSYKSVLDRGFAVVRDDEGKLIGAANAARSGAAIEIEWADGAKGAVLGGKPRKSATQTQSRAKGDEQGTLL